jgi:putative transposase
VYHFHIAITNIKTYIFFGVQKYNFQKLKIAEIKLMDKMEKYRILSPHLEQGVSLATLAKEHNISARTLRRWAKQYKKNSIEGLERKTRVDKGKRRSITPELLEYVKAWALSKPRLSIATIHRKTVALAKSQSKPAPSYSTIYQIITNLDPALITLAHQGSVA